MEIVPGKPTLAPFAYDWVGGDIHGLAQLADTLYGYGPQVTGVATALNAQVQRVVGAAGWQGTAAAAFTAAWGRDSATAQAVQRVADQVATMVGGLATSLSQIEAVLERGADEASAHGVPIGADGAPPQVCYAGTGGPGQAAAQQWLSDYQAFYAKCMKAAQVVRDETAGALAGMARQIVDSASTRPADVFGTLNTVGDLLADLLAGDPAAQEERLIKAIQKAWYGSGSHTPLGRQDDPAPKADEADGTEPDSGPIGLIDELSADIGALLNTYEDVHDYNKSLVKSLVVESFGAEAGLALPKLPELIELLSGGEGGAAGGETAVGGAVEGGEAAADGIDPLALAGVVLTDDIHNLYIENWGADMREHGTVMGALDGYENAVYVNTIKDLESNVVDGFEVSLAPEAFDARKKIGGAIERAWDDAAKDPERALPDILP